MLLFDLEAATGAAAGGTLLWIYRPARCSRCEDCVLCASGTVGLARIDYVGLRSLSSSCSRVLCDSRAGREAR